MSLTPGIRLGAYLAHRRDLIARNAVLSNYNYVFEWIFQQDGSIRGAVGATRIGEVKSTAVVKAPSICSTATRRWICHGDNCRSSLDQIYSGI